MKFSSSIVQIAMVFAAVMVFGCGATEADGYAVENQMALESEPENQEPDYGYEMLPLQLRTNNVTPGGNQWMPNGRVAPEELVRQAAARIEGLRACYEAALITDPALSGEVRAVMEFNADGSLRSLNLNDASTLDPAFSDCMMNVLGTMQVPASNAGVLEVEYPIELNPAVLSSGQ